MTENNTTDIHTEIPVTVTLDLEPLLKKRTRYNDEDGYEDVYGDIISAAAGMVAERMYREHTQYRDKLQEAIDAELEKIVAEAIGKRYQPVDTYGAPKGEPTTLREQIGKQASEALANGMDPGRSYNGYREGVGALKKFIDTEIDRQIKGELAEAVKQAKAAVVDKVKANVTQVITDTITRTAVR